MGLMGWLKRDRKGMTAEEKRGTLPAVPQMPFERGKKSVQQLRTEEKRFRRTRARRRIARASRVANRG